MKRFALLLVLALALGLVAFGVTRRLAPAPAPGEELAWVLAEFQLDAAQAQQVRELHAAYQPVCARHCADIFALRARLAELERDGLTSDPRHAQARAEMEALLETCTRSTRAHLEAVAAVMPPEQGRRYLALVAPKLTQHEHRQPFGLK